MMCSPCLRVSLAVFLAAALVSRSAHADDVPKADAPKPRAGKADGEATAATAATAATPAAGTDKSGTARATATATADLESDDDPAGGAAKGGDPKGKGGDSQVEAAIDPLATPPAVREQIGSDVANLSPSATGPVKQKFFPYYEETRGDYRLRLLPPLYLEHTRGVGTKDEDRESLFALFYYQRRSLKIDADVVFPFLFHLRTGDDHTTVVGPFVHRESSDEHDNWLAPLYFEGKRKHGGYFHAPLLLTFSKWSDESAFTLAGPYFHTRSGTDVDWGIAPFVFHGDNGNIDGAHRTYTLIPPALFYHREREVDGSSLTIAGPVYSESTHQKDVLDVFPLFYHSRYKKASAGLREFHTTLFPLFHYGESENERLFVLPGYYRRVTRETDTLLTPFFSFAETHGGKVHFTAAGPVLPLFMNYSDEDTGLKWTGLFPFFFTSHDSTQSTTATLLFYHKQEYGVSRSTWIFPTITTSQDASGWDFNIHPLVYAGRKNTSSHSVLAPVFWHFEDQDSNATVVFPLFWRFQNHTTGSLTQLAGNTLYMRKRVKGGTDWQFHVLPLFSYGESPGGYFWNVLFGLVGYERKNEDAFVKALWAPIRVDGAKTAPVKREAFAEPPQ